MYIVCRFHSSSCCARTYTFALMCVCVCVHCIRLFWWLVCAYVFAFHFLRTFVCAIRWIRTNTYTSKSIDLNRMHAHSFMCEIHALHTLKEKNWFILLSTGTTLLAEWLNSCVNELHSSPHLALFQKSVRSYVHSSVLHKISIIWTKQKQ